MSATKVQKEALKAFAKDPLDECYDRLDPWCGSNRYSSELRADLQDVGSRWSSQGQASFPYEPMTPEEFTKYSGESFGQWENPGGPPSTWDFWMDWEVLNGKYENPWFNYYETIEDTGAKTTYPPPGDAPWTEEVHGNWSDAVDNRCAEAEEVRGVITDLMEKLVEASEEYGDTDISNSVDLSKYEFSDEE